MAIEQVPVASISVFCVVMVVAVLVIRNLNSIAILISNLWSMLPPNDVIAMYVASGALSVFAIYTINHVVVQGKPINFDTIIKENKYFAVNYYTTAAFCITAIASIFYFTYFYDGGDSTGSNGSNGSNGSSNGIRVLDAVAAAMAASNRNIGTMHVVMFVVAIIALVQMYHVMLWGITNTSIIKAR